VIAEISPLAGKTIEPSTLVNVPRLVERFQIIALSLPLGCLIVDIRMPEMDGLELQQRLTGRGLYFPLIALSLATAMSR
jgi:FixJ family two-component response regulator